MLQDVSDVANSSYGERAGGGATLNVSGLMRVLLVALPHGPLPLGGNPTGF